MSAPLPGSTVTSSLSEARIRARQPLTHGLAEPANVPAAMRPPAGLDASDAIAFTAGMEPGAAVAMVTGAANGLGRAIAARLRDDGFSVAGADIEPVVPDRGIAAYRPGRSRPRRAREPSWTASRKNSGRSRVLVNVAGISVPEPIDRLTLAAYRRQLAVMLDGPVWLARGAGCGWRRAARAASSTSRPCTRPSARRARSPTTAPRRAWKPPPDRWRSSWAPAACWSTRWPRDSCAPACRS